MGDISGIKLEPHLNLRFGKAGKKAQGGEGGEIFIFTEKIQGMGEIAADGGDGQVGGKGGRVHIQAKENDFKGKVSARGGKGR